MREMFRFFFKCRCIVCLGVCVVCVCVCVGWCISGKGVYGGVYALAHNATGSISFRG